MWKFVGCVDLELDALLEVDQVEVDLVGTVVQREVGDQGVHHGRLARPCAPGDEHMLRRAMAQGEVLALGRAGLAERNVYSAAAIASPLRSISGAMNSKATSTRLASRAAAPIFWI